MNFKKIVLSCVFFISTLAMVAQDTNAEKIVQSNLDAYNAHDIDLFMSFFSEEVAMFNFNNSKPTARGSSEIRAIYEPYFKASPNLHSKILKRTVFDNKVIDHEYITGARGSIEAIEMVLIYEVEDNLIVKMTAIRNRN
ncbi:MAG: hypothetical protein ACJAWO_001657 [Halieaceae bacterium]|jgi:hypothetical protein